MNPRSWLRSLFHDQTSSCFNRDCNRSRSRSSRPNTVTARLEILEDRLAPATISISDATAIEGSAAMNLVDEFVSVGSGGSTPRQVLLGPDGYLYVSNAVSGQSTGDSSNFIRGTTRARGRS